MPDLQDGESTEMQGSGSKPYILKNTGGVYSCTCPAWRNQSTAIERRTCKHLRKLRGDAAEEARIGAGPARKTEHENDGDGRPPPFLPGEWRNVRRSSRWAVAREADRLRRFFDRQEP